MITMAVVEQLLENIANVSNAVFFICNSKEIYSYIACPKYLLDEGKSWNELVPPNDLERLLENAGRYIESRDVEGIEYEESFPITFHIPSKETPVNYELHFIVRARYDSGHYAVLAATPKLSPDEAGQLLFISMVSHELRTPLTSIMGTLALLQDQFASEEQNMLLRIAQRNSERLLVIINDILSMQSIAMGRMTFHITKSNLVSLVKNSIEANQGYAERYGVTFVMKESSERLVVSCDPLRTLQIINNYLSNAAKYSYKGGEVEILVDEVVVNGEEFGRVSVIDHGEGIEATEHPRIFDRYYQSDATIANQKGGSGLGLFITKYIAESQGGSVGFTSEVGSGSTFYFLLPKR